jgi:hypothetical protein
MRNACRVLFVRTERKRQFGRRSVDVTIMDFKEIRYEAAGWIHLVLDRVRRRTLVNR